MRALALVVTIGTAVATAQTPVFRSSVDVVSVNVLVKSDRKPVPGLVASDFRLFDGQVAQQIDIVSAESLPLDVTLLLDSSGSVEGARMSALKTAVRDTSRVLGPNDRMRLLSFSSTVRQVFDFRSGRLDYGEIDLRAGGATSLYDAIVAAMMKPRDLDRLELIVAFTDGRDTISSFDATEVHRLAGLTDAVVYVVVGIEPPLGHIPAQRLLQDLAAATGGAATAFNLTAPLSKAFLDVIDNFHHSYVLRYTPKGVERGGWHPLRVEIPTHGSYDVRARTGYLGPS